MDAKADATALGLNVPVGETVMEGSELLDDDGGLVSV